MVPRPRRARTACYDADIASPPETRPAPPSPMTDPANDSWTGGQYSLARAFFGLTLAAWCAWIALHAAAIAQAGADARGAVAVALAAVAAGVFLAIGALDRGAAAVLFGAGLFLGHEGLVTAGAGGLAPAGLLLIHLRQKAAPYGSFAAIGRIDPGGGWRPRRGFAAAVYLVLALAQVAAAFRGPLAHGFPDTFGATLLAAWPLVAGLAAAAAAFVPPLRGAVFIALAATHLVGLLRGGGGVDAAFLIALPFAIDPGWFGGARAAAPDRVFYDGDCGLCHRAVRFLLAEDRDGARFRFAPLAGAEAARRLGAVAARDLPDSIVLVAGEVPDRLFVRSGAVLRALDRLGGLWRVVAIAGRIVPPGVADALYDAVARVRKRLFAAPKAACPLIPPALRGRFILEEGPVAAPTDNRPGETPSPGSPDGSPPRSQ